MPGRDRRLFSLPDFGELAGGRGSGELFNDLFLDETIE